MIENFKFWVFNQNPIIQALMAGLFTWFITAIGSGLVFFFNSSNRKACTYYWVFSWRTIFIWFRQNYSSPTHV